MTNEPISHDKLFRTVFEFFLADLIELVHPQLAAVLDLDHARPADKKLFVDFRKEGHVEPDFVAAAETVEGEPRWVLVHVEAEGQFLESVDERMCRYSMHLRLKSNRPVISIAVFLRGGLPGVEVREVVDRVGPFEINRFRYLAFGLSGSLAEEYVHRPQPLAAALAALMRSEIWDRVEKKLQCFKAISRAEDLDRRRLFLLARMVDTYVELTEDEDERFAAEIGRESYKEVRDMVVTWEEALAESRAEGQTEAKQEDILLIGRHRFSSLPPGFEAKVRSIEDPDRLRRILDQMLEVDSIGSIDLG